MRVVSNVAARLSGSLGGIVASAGSTGLHIRVRSARVQPRSARASGAAALLGGISSAWATLSADQRAGWNKLAATQPWGKRGDGASPLSGYSLFVRCNRNRFTIGAGGFLVDAPAQPIIPLIWDVSASILYSAPEPPNYPVFLALGFEFFEPVKCGVILWASVPCSPGRTYIDRSLFRIFGTYLEGLTGVPDQLGAYEGVWGKIPPNCTIAFGVTLIDAPTGWASPMYRCTLPVSYQTANPPPGGNVTIEVNGVPVAQTSGVTYEVGGVPVASGS